MGDEKKIIISKWNSKLVVSIRALECHISVFINV